ncbi:MAG: hypothetical protein IKU32_09500 [Clostridia bacterium]|nr:hypothetical protein [Clostridia bacterium]
MKKIFAIALALVMVLSMASAFAFCPAGTYDWACATDVCNFGKATVEVVPYVVANDCDGKGSTYVQSDCAAAVFGQNVYYAIKVTVPADINDEWFSKAVLDVDLTGIDGTEFTAKGLQKAISKDENYGKKELTYYFDSTSTVISADAETFELKNVIWTKATVNNAKTAKVCATLTSELYPVDKYVEVGNYKVIYRTADKNLVVDVFDGKNWDYSAAIIHFNKDSKVEWVASDFEGSATDNKFVAWDGDQLVKADGTRVGTSCGAAAKVAAALKYFNINFGTCITEKAIKANFGWKDEVKACATWSSNAMSVVDAECVVAIPKTGDASVLAWLF